ncbi:unnamed protein product [Microthlaspi erraticum]|uniref:Uncharacterized protein n=1 Tax=Microthlaspi erraticum TaxID=1685480 RepID=A0A6D2JHN6_9BRAS|nr:unnamed protein product [Microthlaspi erraticum]
MFWLVQNRIGNTLFRLKPRASLALFSALVENLSTASERLPETIHESSDSEAIWNVIVGRAGDRVSEDEVFNRLSNDEICNRVNLSDALIHKLLHRFRDDWRSALGSDEDFPLSFNAPSSGIQHVCQPFSRSSSGKDMEDKTDRKRC